MNSIQKKRLIDSLLLSLTGVSILLYFVAPSLSWDPTMVKSLPAFLLAIWMTLRYGERTRKAAIALVFSGIGDIMGDLDLFPLQLLCFLIAHLFLIASFLPRFQFNLRSKIALSICIFFLLTFGSILLPNIDSSLLTILVALYMTIIATMAFTAVSQRKTNVALFIAGALSFTISDSLIAIDRFIEHLPFRTILVMGSYYLALVLLSIAIVDSKKRGKEPKPSPKK